MKENDTMEQTAEVEAMPRTDGNATGEEAREAAERICGHWLAQARETGAEHPDFDLEAQLADPGFRRLLAAGVSVRQAYRLQQLDRLLARAKTLEEQQARRERPTENGAAMGSAVTLRRDVRALDRQARADLVKRAARGEEIAF